MEEPEDAIRPSRAQDIDKKDNRGDVLPEFPEGTAEFRLGKERTKAVKGEKPLSFQEESFIRRYFVNGFNHRDAAKYANIPYQDVGKMLRKSNVRARMDKIQNELSEELKLSQHKIVGDLYQMFTAELSDIVEIRRGACRFCWGVNFGYQWRTSRERDESKKKPSIDGGEGYSEYTMPNPECPECSGAGFAFVHNKETSGRKGVHAIEHSPSGKIVVKGYDKAKIGELLLKHLAEFLPEDVQNVITNVEAIGGVTGEFHNALAAAGSLEAIEADIAARSKSLVASVEIAANEQKG